MFVKTKLQAHWLLSGYNRSTPPNVGLSKFVCGLESGASTVSVNAAIYKDEKQAMQSRQVVETCLRAKRVGRTPVQLDLSEYI